MKRNQKASTLVVVLIMLLIFMGMVVGFSFDSRSQSVFNAGGKLHAFYRATGEMVLSNYRSSVLPDEYVPVDPAINNYTFAEMAEWRFGLLLTSGLVEGQYGVLVDEGDTPQNDGMLNLHYRIWVNNNPEDPVYALRGFTFDDGAVVVDEDWDLDGKIVLTVEIFRNDVETEPVLVLSHQVAVSGSENYILGTDIGQEGNDLSASNQGTGTVGESGSINLQDNMASETSGTHEGGVAP